MAELHELCNLTFSIRIAGIEFKARRPRILRLFAAIESHIISAETLRIDDAATTLKLTGSERLAFLQEQYAALPKASALQLEVIQLLGSPKGVIEILKECLSRDQPNLTDEQIGMLMDSDMDGATAAAELLMGVQKKKVVLPVQPAET